jgi:hypothetical protein
MGFKMVFGYNGAVFRVDLSTWEGGASSPTISLKKPRQGYIHLAQIIN